MVSGNVNAGRRSPEGKSAVNWHVTACKAGVRMNIAQPDTEAEAREMAKVQSLVLGQRRWVLLVIEVRDSGQRTTVTAYRKGRETNVRGGW